MKTAHNILLSLLFLICLPIQAVTVYISCHENIDIDHLKTALSLKNLDIINTTDAQFDLCFSVNRKTIITSDSGLRLGAGYGHRSSSRNYYGTGISFDPFWDNDQINTTEQSSLMLQIKDSQGRSVWRDEKAYTGNKQINKALRTLINNIPLSIVTQNQSTTPRNHSYSTDYE